MSLEQILHSAISVVWFLSSVLSVAEIRIDCKAKSLWVRKASKSLKISLTLMITVTAWIYRWVDGRAVADKKRCQPLDTFPSFLAAKGQTFFNLRIGFFLNMFIEVLFAALFSTVCFNLCICRPIFTHRIDSVLFNKSFDDRVVKTERARDIVWWLFLGSNLVAVGSLSHVVIKWKSWTM